MIIQFIVHQAVVAVVCLPPHSIVGNQLKIQIREIEELPMDLPGFVTSIDSRKRADQAG
jgi:hypothetical protein